MSAQLIHEDIISNGIRLSCARCGDGPLMVLLHGFPECWYSWRSQIPALAAAGFHVVAPDLRGYNTSEKPATGYDINTLTADVLGVMDHYGSSSASVVGHDWGGVVAWNLAVTHPERLDRLIILNLPHPTLLARALLRNPRQMLRSWYILFFQVPWLPELLLGADNAFAIGMIIRLTAAHPERFDEEDLWVFRRAAAQPGALTAMLRWYRSLRPGQILKWAAGGSAMTVQAPTLLIWGEKDTALGKELTHGTEEFVGHLQVEYLPDASHWVQQDEPEAVTRLMLEFLSSS